VTFSEGTMLTRSRIIVGALVIAACAAIAYVASPLRVNDEAALASLSEYVLSKRYTSGFWDEERRGNTPLWSKALSRCQESPPLTIAPNCQVVVLVSGNSAQEKLARELLSERRRVESWLKDGADAEIGDGLTGRGAKAGALPTLTHEAP
jgi:hypothetical protein